MTDPTEARSGARAAIIDVAARLLHDTGPAGLTTRAVAEGAGVQVPTIYRLFGDKDGLVEAVAEHVLARHVAGKVAVEGHASTTEVDPVEELRAGWRSQVEFGLANPAVYGLLVDPARAPRSGAARSGRQVLAARVHRIARAGRLRVSERRAVEMVHAAGTGTILALLATPAADRDPGLADVMFEAVLDRMLTTASAQPGTGSAPAAVAVRAVVSELAGLSNAEQLLLAEWLDRVVATEQSVDPPPAPVSFPPIAHLDTSDGG